MMVLLVALLLCFSPTHAEAWSSNGSDCYSCGRKLYTLRWFQSAVTDLSPPVIRSVSHDPITRFFCLTSDADAMVVH